jgi:hypothetical protein
MPISRRKSLGFALRFCFDYPDAGMSTAQEVSRNRSAMDGGPPPETLREFEAILAPVHNTVWISGHPENNLPG